MDKKTASWVSYLTFIGAIIVLCTVKDDKEVRTHAWQSIFLCCAYAAVAIVLAIINAIIIAASPVYLFGGFWLTTTLGWLAWVAYIVLDIICLVKATQDSIFKLPLIYTWAEKMK